ncbi:MAG: hypothetical protein Q7R93_02390 [bacterium]|nr:hypothetical protein [bacterium]
MIKRFLKPMYLFAVYIVALTVLVGYTVWDMQDRGYEVNGVREILSHPTDHLYKIWISTNVVSPANLIPNGVAKTVKVTISSTDGWIALCEIALGVFVVLLLLFAAMVFLGKAGAEEKKVAH